MIVPTLLLLFITSSLSELITCPKLSELDALAPSSYCSERYYSKKLKPGDHCLIRPERVRPTQVFVGKVEMECTKRQIETKNSSDLRALLIENYVPAVIGPGPEFYITDHHHFAVALFQSFLDFKRPSIHRVLYACVQADYSHMGMEEFWGVMKENQFVYLEDERGNNISYADIPETLKLMADNPYRTLASWLRTSNAFVKCGTKKTHALAQCKGKNAPFFLECFWADYMRTKFPIDNYPIIPEVRPLLEDFIYRASLQLQTEAMVSILQEAVWYAIAPEAQNMPGYNLAQDKLVPTVVKLDAFGCPL